MALPVELQLCRRFPQHLHPLQLLLPPAAAAALAPGPGTDCVLALHLGSGPGPVIFTSAAIVEAQPPGEEAGAGAGDEGDTGPGAGDEGGTGPGAGDEGGALGLGQEMRGALGLGQEMRGTLGLGQGMRGTLGLGLGAGDGEGIGPGVRGEPGAGGEWGTGPRAGDEGGIGPGVRGEPGLGAAVTELQGRGAGVTGSSVHYGGIPTNQSEGVSRGVGPVQIYTSKLFLAHYRLWAGKGEAPGLGEEGWSEASGLEVDDLAGAPGLGELNRAGAPGLGLENSVGDPVLGEEGRPRLQASLVKRVPGLSRVVLGARTRGSLRWASSPAFARGLLVLSCQRRAVLLRQGDPPVVPYHPCLGEDSELVQARLLELVVLECQPVLQGLLTPSTSLALTDFREPGQLPPSPPLHLLQPLCLSDFAHYARGLWGSGLASGLQGHGPSDFQTVLRALECRLEVVVADLPGLAERGELGPGPEAPDEAGCLEPGLEAQDVESSVAPDLRGPAHGTCLEPGPGTPDLDSCLLLSRRTLYRLGLFHRQWVLVSWPEPGAEPESPGAEGRVGATRPAQLPARVLAVEVGEGVSLQLGQDTAAISHAMWFNVSRGAPAPSAHRTLRVKRFLQGAVGQQGVGDSCSELGEPPLAEELHVEVIHSPTYDARATHDRLLYQHFSTCRLVYEGAVLCVQARGRPDFTQTCTQAQVGCPVIYLRVRSVRGGAGTEGAPGYLAHTGHTSLYLDGCGNGHVPCAAASDGHPFWGSLSPPGLSCTVEALCHIIEPYLRHGPPVLEGPCSVLLCGASGCGKSTVVRAACRRLNLHLLQVDCVCLCADSPGAWEAKLEGAVTRAEAHRPCVLLLRDVTVMGREREGAPHHSRLVSALQRLLSRMQPSGSEYPVVVLGTAVRQREVSAELHAVFLHELAVSALSEEQRQRALKALGSSLPFGKDVNLGRVAKLTAGYVLGDLCSLLSRASRSACRRLRQRCFPCLAPSEQEELELCAAGVVILQDDLLAALEELQAVLSRAVGAPKVPAVSWQDVGGLEAVKRLIVETVQLPLEQPGLLSQGLRRTGLLLYGPPGSGKTLLAKAVATQCASTFLSVKGPELINMYVGQSEENVREGEGLSPLGPRARARTAAPCVVFFDELDSLAPSRGRSGDSGGVTDRVVSQLLAELDGLHSTGDVFVIGATNRPDLLDQALLRPGRWAGQAVYVGLGGGMFGVDMKNGDSQLRVLQAITRKFSLDPAVSLRGVVEQCPSRLSGADLYSLCSEAVMAAVKRRVARVGQGLEVEDAELALLPEDFERALSTLQPSVSQQEMEQYRLMQQRLSAR
ncbi:LOW QUALITY PROTEIN: peroxisomal ATPase PEX6 [Leucoraja erinacea]|uniref:LOW QUALITY PROTEIN: peroxisomal ATPase PEX6 n=1 Tax=Leucoraja erinaceus TaxID=7782 RepID=UPI002453B23A|nr:LOW QUALITY PROTEIN: peroxisomal ATPase PEX6 [Leucoraja erinacea]